MTELQQGIFELKSILGQAEAEVNSLLAGKKAAAPRIRASLQKLKSISHNMRAVVMDYTKALPVKSRAPAKKEDLQINRPTAAVMAEESTEQPQTPAPPGPVKKQRKKAIKPKPC